jgi:nitrous oxidase accessory protein NosD
MAGYISVKVLAMKKLCGLLALLLVLNSCAHVMVVDSKPKQAPPGQVKKVTGSQSAKPYAPGQQKKKR